MKKRTILAVASLCGVATMSVLTLSGLSGEAREFFADGDAGIWVHYARKEATKTEKGIREYWVNCSSHEYVFEQPTSGTIQEFTKYDTSGFTEDDDRWINTVTMTAKDVIMTEATKVLDLGAYAGGTITKMTAGTSKAGATLDLGTDATNLDVSGFDEDHKDDGVKTVEVNTIKDGKEYKIYAETTFVTAMISDVAGFINYVQVDSAIPAKYGYIKMAQNINLNNSAFSPKFDFKDYKFNEANFFGGTFDGNGKTITYKSGGATGIFYNLNNGAIIKNLNIQDYYYNNDSGSCLIARSIWNSTLENVTTKIYAANTAMSAPDAVAGINNQTGYLAAIRAQGLTMKNCTFDCSGYALASFIGRGGNYTMPTVQGCTIKAKSLVEAMYSSYLATPERGGIGTYQPENVTLKEGEGYIPGLTFEQA